MSLTKELLKKSTKLEGLSDDQFEAIVTLSVNDEDSVIKKKTGEIYGGIDTDITEATGTEKPQGMKTYDWLKSLLPDVKKITEYKSTIETLTQEKKDIEKLMSEGKSVDETLKKKLEDKDQEIVDLKKQMDADKKLLDTKTEEFEKTNFDLRFDFISSEAEKNLTFIDAIQPSVQGTLIESAKSKILNEYEVAEEKDTEGKTYTVFKKDGVIVKNPNDSLNPYTLEDLYRQELKDSLKAGENKKGAGSKEKGGNINSPIDISGAKSQIEADELIAQQVMKEGITRDSQGFQPRFDELRNENKVSSLPIKSE